MANAQASSVPVSNKKVIEDYKKLRSVLFTLGNDLMDHNNEKSSDIASRLFKKILPIMKGKRWKTSNRALITLQSPCRSKASQKLRLVQGRFSSVPLNLKKTCLSIKKIIGLAEEVEKLISLIIRLIRLIRLTHHILSMLNH